MKPTHIPTDKNRVRRQQARVATHPQDGEEEYRVGPGRPPKEFQFKPGQSGNPKGKRRKGSLVGQLKAELERALRQNVTLRQGEKEQTVTMRAAGIRQLDPVRRWRPPCAARLDSFSRQAWRRSDGRPGRRN